VTHRGEATLAGCRPRGNLLCARCPEAFRDQREEANRTLTLSPRRSVLTAGYFLASWGSPWRSCAHPESERSDNRIQHRKFGFKLRPLLGKFTAVSVAPMRSLFVGQALMRLPDVRIQLTAHKPRMGAEHSNAFARWVFRGADLCKRLAERKRPVSAQRVCEASDSENHPSRILRPAIHVSPAVFLERNCASVEPPSGAFDGEGHSRGNMHMGHDGCEAPWPLASNSL